MDQELCDKIDEFLVNLPSDLTAQEQYISSNPDFEDHMKQYDSFFQSLMDGKLGPTAQYWSMYVFMVNRVHRDLMRAHRTNDIEKYTIVLPALIDVFFGLNRPNYARWATLFLQQLITASPPSQNILRSGAFSIRRTRKN